MFAAIPSFVILDARLAVAITRQFGKVCVELVFFLRPVVGIRRRILAHCDVRPFFGVFRVDRQPFSVRRIFGVRHNGFGGTFWFADATVDTFFRVDDEHVLAFVEAVHWANFDAVGVLTFDAGVEDDVGQGSSSEFEFRPGDE